MCVCDNKILPTEANIDRVRAEAIESERINRLRCVAVPLARAVRSRASKAGDRKSADNYRAAGSLMDLLQVFGACNCKCKHAAFSAVCTRKLRLSNRELSLSLYFSSNERKQCPKDLVPLQPQAICCYFVRLCVTLLFCLLYESIHSTTQSYLRGRSMRLAN